MRTPGRRVESVPDDLHTFAAWLHADRTDSLAISVFPPEAEASLPSRKKTAADAIATLRQASFEPREPKNTYLRGTAWLAAGDGSQGATPVQTILYHRDGRLQSQLYRLARLGLRRALWMKGDNASSVEAYLGFLDLWRNADLEFPLLAQARID